MEKINQLFKESVFTDKECNLCNEISLDIGEKTPYGAIVVYRIGSFEDGWFATLSPRIGGDPEKDFTIQLMPFAHLTHFSQMDTYPNLASNYGIAFSRLSNAMTTVLAEENSDFESSTETREQSTSVATYGKCTNWKEKKEHLHIKLYPFKGNIGQPSPVDSSFGRKEIHKEGGEEFIKMDPVRKVPINQERMTELSNKLIHLLK